MDREMYEQYRIQDALQRDQIDAQQALNAPMLHEQMQQNQAVLVEQTNPKRIVKEIILRLKGLQERNDGTLVRVSKPKLNEVGIENISFIINSHINQNTILSHLDHREISKIMFSVSESLVDNLKLNWKDYGIERKTDLDDINDSVLINIFLALKRSEGQNEKNWLGKISVENISSASRMPQIKKDSFWGKFRL